MRFHCARYIIYLRNKTDIAPSTHLLSRALHFLCPGNLSTTATRQQHVVLAHFGYHLRAHVGVLGTFQSKLSLLRKQGRNLC